MPAHKLTTDSERFYRNVGPLNSSGCRLWLGSIAKTRGGYGMISTGSRAEGTFKYRRANRFALELALGRSLLPGMFALHTCDVPVCVCTDGIGFYEINGVLRHRCGHLWEGTCEENIADKVKKGRSATGERNDGQKRLAKLNANEVLQIRERSEKGEILESLADAFGVTPSNIWYIINRKTWRHI